MDVKLRRSVIRSACDQAPTFLPVVRTSLDPFRAVVCLHVPAVAGSVLKATISPPTGVGIKALDVIGPGQVVVCHC